MNIYTFYLISLLVIGTTAGISLSVVPQSRNISEGKLVEFSCATPDTGVNLAWNTIPHVVTATINNTVLPGGGTLSALSFTARAQHNNTLITCLAIKVPNADQSTALLLVQGKPIKVCTAVNCVMIIIILCI